MKRTHHIFLTATALMALGWSATAAEPNSATLLAQVQQQIGQVQNTLKASQLDQLTARLKVARDEFTRFEQNKEVDSLGENKWKVAQALRQDLVFMHLAAAQALYDNGRFDNALQILKDAEGLEATLPVTAYFSALNYLKQGKEWDATRALYEAKRLNAFPALRKMENPSQPWEVLATNPVELETRVDALLKQMGKDLEYPISLNFETGQHEYMSLVPGVGANLMGRDGSHFNLYLKKDMINKVLDSVGKPREIEERYMRDQMLNFYIYDNYYIVGVNPENQIERIQIDRPGYSVRVNGKAIQIGDAASVAQQILGESSAAVSDAEKLGGDGGQIKETWVYNNYGLSLGITQDNRVGVISIWTLE